MTDNFNIPSFCCIFVSRLITSIETRNVRFFTFVFSVKGMISVILILVVAAYQQILSSTKQGLIGLLRGNQTSIHSRGWVMQFPTFLLGVGQSFLCRREGVGHVFFFLSTTLPNALAHHSPPPYTFLPVPKDYYEWQGLEVYFFVHQRLI